MAKYWSFKKRTAPGVREPGPHGVTVDMIELSKTLRPRSYRFRATPKDRSLHGKARIRARKAAQRRPLTSASDW